jgi:hypothetical protein
MAALTKQFLSGSTNGRLIKVAAVATPGTLIHTAVAGESDIDEIWLYAVCTAAPPALLTVEYGGVASPDDLVEITVNDEVGLVLVVPGLILQNGLVVRAFASVANVINVGGFVNRITA